MISSAVSATSWLGLSASGPSAPIRTRPARTDSAALVRERRDPALGEQGVDPLPAHAAKVARRGRG